MLRDDSVKTWCRKDGTGEYQGPGSVGVGDEKEGYVRKTGNANGTLKKKHTGNAVKGNRFLPVPDA